MVVGSIPHVEFTELSLVTPIAPQLVKQGRGMWYPVCGMVHIKYPLLLIEKSSLCSGGSGMQDGAPCYWSKVAIEFVKKTKISVLE